MNSIPYGKVKRIQNQHLKCKGQIFTKLKD